MTKIIVTTSGKGGVGKTTTSASFSTGLAARGKKVAVIDFDARYMLKTDDGAVIYLQNRGYRWGPPEIMAAMARRDHGVDEEPVAARRRDAPRRRMRADDQPQGFQVRHDITDGGGRQFQPGGFGQRA